MVTIPTGSTDLDRSHPRDLDISADGKALAINTWGIDSYPADRFLEPSDVAAPRRILGFRIEAE